MAHRDRNQLTSLVFSLTLGFIVFISIVSKIPFMKEISEDMMHSGLDDVVFSTYNIPLHETDALIERYAYAF